MGTTKLKIDQGSQAMIHKAAIISPKAEIADDVMIGPYAVIGDDVAIGAGCRIDAHAIVTGPTTLGERNHIYSHAVVGGDPQDKKYDQGAASFLTIGDGNTIREFVTINRGGDEEGHTEIGDNNWIMAYVHIAHACRVGSNIVMANNTTLAGHVEIGDFATLGGFSKVHQFCRVGQFALLGFDSGINRDVPPYVIVKGYEAEPKSINTVGLQRNGFESDQIRNIREAYKILYRKGLTLDEAMSQLKSRSTSQSELKLLCDFLATTERSITR